MFVPNVSVVRASAMSRCRRGGTASARDKPKKSRGSCTRAHTRAHTHTHTQSHTDTDDHTQDEIDERAQESDEQDEAFFELECKHRAYTQMRKLRSTCIDRDSRDLTCETAKGFSNHR